MDLASASQAGSLPSWMIVFSFVVSLLFTLFAGVEIVSRLLSKAELQVVLTREMFYRVLESGESIYANAVLVAHDSGALVKNVKATLQKTDRPTKTFDLSVALVGEKYRTSDGAYLFGFHSTSPLAFMPENVPQQIVYVCEHDSYAKPTRQCFTDFWQDVYNFKTKYRATNKPEPTANDPSLEEFKALVDRASTRVMDQLQIEGGQYKLTVKVQYRQKGKFLSVFRGKLATGSISFSIAEHAKDDMRFSVCQYLQRKAIGYLTGGADPIPFPEYQPQNIVESSP